MSELVRRRLVIEGGTPALDVDIKAFKPIPEEGIAAAAQVMRTGRTFRYGPRQPEHSEVSNFEREFASLLGDMGSEVHLFEVVDQILPGMEPEAAKVLNRELRKKGVKVRAGIAVGPPQPRDDSVVVPFGDDAVEVSQSANGSG